MLTSSAVAILSESYAKIGEIGTSIVKNMVNGLEYSPAQTALYDRLIRSTILYERILKHVVLNANRDRILAVYNISSTDLNTLLFELKRAAGVNRLPATVLPLRVYNTSLIGQGATGATGLPGANAYVYVRYASDNVGTDFSAVPGPTLHYFSIKNSTTPLPDVPASHAGNWTHYKGDDGEPGVDGEDGISTYTYQAWADANDGTGFTLTFNALKPYTAFFISTSPTPPVQADFNGLWAKYLGTNGTDGINGLNGATIWYGSGVPSDLLGNDGDSYLDTTNFVFYPNKTAGVWSSSFSIVGPTGNDGNDGSNGSNGADGAAGTSSYLYIGFATDSLGTGFTTVQSSDKPYINFQISTTELTPVVGDFTGPWIMYQGNGDRWTTTSSTSLTIGVAIHSLIVEKDLAYSPGQYVVIADALDPTTNNMEGQVISYSSSSGILNVNVTTVNGSGTIAVWAVSIQASGGGGGGGISTVYTDDISITGDGSSINKVRIKPGYLGSAAFSSTTDFDAAGDAAAAEAAANAYTDGALASKEDTANKVTTFATVNNTLFPTLQAVEDRIRYYLASLVWKTPAAKVATTGNITLSGPQTIDGVSVIAGDVVLVWQQTTAHENGIYTVAAGAWTRRADADTGAELESAVISIQAGTLHANKIFLQTSTSITIGVTDIVWEQFGSVTSTATPNASLTESGKVQEASDAETIAGTSTGTTGAKLAVTPERLLNWWNSSAKPEIQEPMMAAFDGMGATLTVGSFVLLHAPRAGTISAWSIHSQGGGTLTLDIWKIAGSTNPTVADTITGSAKPAVTSGDRVRSTTLTGWTTAVAQYDLIIVYVEACANINKAVLYIEYD